MWVCLGAASNCTSHKTCISFNSAPVLHLSILAAQSTLLVSIQCANRPRTRQENCTCVCRVFLWQAQAGTLQQQVRSLEQEVARLKETSDANSDVLKGKMANLDGRLPVADSTLCLLA